MWPLVFERDRLAVWLALGTGVFLLLGFLVSKGTQVLMPGPLASAHGAIENCSACHAKSGSGKLSWVGGLIPGDPHADSKACLTCHKMPETAFNAHGAAAEVLGQSTERLTKIAARTPVPQSARAQSVAFPTNDMVAGGLACATCHQEHQGADFKLSRISNEQCRSCHVVKFDSFDGRHPKFESYPFKRRTRIIYDHAGHFGKHYPEVAKKDPAKRIPETCATCHNSRDDKRVMAVAPFEKTCASCHLDQIIGKERATGPKGVAFLSLPGLDLETLRSRKAQIGEWPDASEAELAPFMKVMISRNENGRALIRAVDGLNLQDLANASDDQIEAVTGLAWEIKGLIYALIKDKASDVLGDLNIVSGAKLSPGLVADLTASIPRDVVASAQQQWLPNLAAEMPNRPARRDHGTSGWNTVTTESRSAGKPPGSPARRATTIPDPRAAGRDRAPGRAVGGAAGSGGIFGPGGDGAASPGGVFGGGGVGAAGPGGAIGRGVGRASGPRRLGGPPLPPAMRAGIRVAEQAAQSDGAAEDSDAANAPADDGERRLAADEGGGVITGRMPLPSGTPRAINARSTDDADAAEPEDAAGNNGDANARDEAGGQTRDADEQPRAGNAGSEDAPKPAQPEAAPAKADAADAKADGGNAPPQDQAAEQTDDLLFPTEEELRASKAGDTGVKKAATVSEPKNAAPDTAASAEAAAEEDANVSADTAAGSDAAASAPQTAAAPVISIASDVDPESWAEYGGWYRQDYTIYYRPTGHKDKFIYSWLFLAGPKAPPGEASPAAAVFDFLTGKDAQGACTKCHSVDAMAGKGRVVNFSPTSVASKQGRFTNFIHEPHFGILENRGCLTCHSLEKGRPYLKSYEQGNPQSFASNFGEVKKDLCKTCHTRTMARQDCLTCHKYHVNDVITPIINTKLPTQ